MSRCDLIGAFISIFAASVLITIAIFPKIKRKIEERRKTKK